MADSAIDVYYDTALKYIKEAGQVLLTAEPINVEEKKPGDIVSEFDSKIEEILIQRLKKSFRNHRFIGEEESYQKHGINELTDEPTWIIDPIDGTANFIRKIPVTCISVGFVLNKEPTIGIIYNPFHNELYTAIKGRGAYLNGKKIFPSKTEDINRACFNYELSLARVDSLRNMYITRLKYITAAAAGIRSLGCAALGLCYVARGYHDAYQCDGLYPWDVAAGSLIVQEAGGYVCDPTGSEFDLIKANILACATKKLAKQFVEIEKKADEEWKLLS